MTPETHHVTRGWVHPLWTGILTDAQLTLSRHYWVGIWHDGVLGVHESLGVRDRFWFGRCSNPWVERKGNPRVTFDGTTHHHQPGRQTAKTSSVGLSYHRRHGSSPHSCFSTCVMRPGLTAGALGPVFFLKVYMVYMELGSYFLFLQEQIKDIIIKCLSRCVLLQYLL